MILLSIAYLPPVQYLSKFIKDQEILIEKQENYPKQSYRNRCRIYGANGIQELIIPVKCIHGKKNLVGDVEIDYTKSWQNTHWKSIESAYRKSPFFEFYADELKRLYTDFQPLNLFEWDICLLEYVLEILEIKTQISFTDSFINKPDISIMDFRNSIHPKINPSITDNSFIIQEYQQVFKTRHGFKNNLSIIDLLFNEGACSSYILKESISQ